MHTLIAWMMEKTKPSLQCKIKINIEYVKCAKYVKCAA
uniref:Uncharacterized protein n=1 Tax=viral metagenome TaxID=1070528 RepID=A0A6C0I679_9ZZZZ